MSRMEEAVAAAREAVGEQDRQIEALAAKEKELAELRSQQAAFEAKEEVSTEDLVKHDNLRRRIRATSATAAHLKSIVEAATREARSATKEMKRIEAEEAYLSAKKDTGEVLHWLRTVVWPKVVERCQQNTDLVSRANHLNAEVAELEGRRTGPVYSHRFAGLSEIQPFMGLGELMNQNRDFHLGVTTPSTAATPEQIAEFYPVNAPRPMRSSTKVGE